MGARQGGGRVSLPGARRGDIAVVGKPLRPRPPDAKILEIIIWDEPRHPHKDKEWPKVTTTWKKALKGRRFDEPGMVVKMKKSVRFRRPVFGLG